MAHFLVAIELVLQHEGGYTVDHAGPTNFGITTPTLARFLDTHEENVAPALIKNLTRTQATEIYRRLWWHKYGYGDIKDQAVANKVMDMSVNMGPRMAHKLLQRACNEQRSHQIKVDGVLGPLTLDAVNVSASAILVDGLRSQSEAFYRRLAKRDPEKYGEYLNGWIPRARA